MDRNKMIDNWLHYKAISLRFKNTMDYVDHCIVKNGKMRNGNTCSIEFESILLLACSEFESVLKQICEVSSIELPNTPDISDMTKKVLSKYPHTTKIEIYSLNSQCEIPLKEWGIQDNKVLGLQWWFANNAIKHNRKRNFEKANLYNCYNAIASLLAVELLLWKISAISEFDFPLGDDEYFNSHYLPQYRTTSPFKNFPGFD